jgi:hypothetical protein
MSRYPRAATVIALLVGPGIAGAQMLETETARILRPGRYEIGINYEWQSSREGRESALPFALELGLTPRLEFVLEPVPFTAIRPRAGARATGPGDLEATFVYLARRESTSLPAFALAGEIKFPTARSSLIGTGETDYTAYLLASRRTGRFDSHLNVGYTVVGRTEAGPLSDLVSFAAATEYVASRRWQWFGEVLGNVATSGAESADAAGGGAAVVPEAAGGELVATLGVARRISESARGALSLSRDNSGAWLIRPGLTVWFR